MGSIGADLTAGVAGAHPLYSVFTGSEAGTVGAVDFFSSITGACCDSVFTAAREFRALGAV
jgi:hypothetical protein